jgi:outer membrane protein assembly factor BamA
MYRFARSTFQAPWLYRKAILIKNSKPLIAGDYKRSFVLSFAQANLIPIYRERGHLRANFRAPLAKLESDATSNCKGGVSLTVPIEEGAVYSWGKAEWTGNTVLPNPELEAALGMKTSEVANGLKIDKGLMSIQEAYGRKGYLAARLNPSPVFEDANQNVTYQIAIKEGSQYRMGILTITGFSENTTNRLKSKWKLQLGDVYDASYLKEFMKKEMVLDAREIGSPPKSISTEIKPDRHKLTVDLTISLK